MAAGHGYDNFMNNKHFHPSNWTNLRKVCYFYVPYLLVNRTPLDCTNFKPFLMLEMGGRTKGETNEAARRRDEDAISKRTGDI